ncbi:MAG TPA: glycosyltransferase family 4 protein [Pyrinomonadaceae bacterium]|nr:glycosyltransferase family 4 protein [Pyrinomonadaceae bacterium]
MANLPLHRVAILTSHFSTGDAVSNDVVGMCHAFLRRGYEARIYAGGWDESEHEVFPVTEIRQFLRDPSDLLIYHYSIQWPPGLELLHDPGCRTVIKYHNVTPPEFFVGISEWHEEKCRIGRAELKTIAGAGCRLYLADSEYNRQDLLHQGVAPDKSFVVPPFHHIDRLRAIEADLKVLDEYRDGKTNILMVGRVAPNKGHQYLIEAFTAYHHEYNRDSRLLIVGKEEQAFKVYSRRLRNLAAQLLSAEAILFTGEATESELKAYYLLASVFAMPSEHEGFCVPLIEAMSMKVPVVAYSSSAIPATVGGAGLVFEERSPRLMAGAINRLVTDEAMTFALGMKGWRRYERHFTNLEIERELFRSLSHLE